MILLGSRLFTPSPTLAAITLLVTMGLDPQQVRTPSRPLLRMRQLLICGEEKLQKIPSLELLRMVVFRMRGEAEKKVRLPSAAWPPYSMIQLLRMEFTSSELSRKLICCHWPGCFTA